MSEKKANHQAKVVRIANLRPHPDPETTNLELTDIDGYQVVVGKGNFNSKSKRRGGTMDTEEGIRFLQIMAWVILIVVLLNSFGHGATTSHSKNSLGVVTYDANPYMYVAGSIAHTADAVTVVDGNLNLRVKPLGTYMLYDESILFCGIPQGKFDNINAEALVLTFERKARRTVQGIGCHELVRVDNMIPKQGQ